ncbi:hypothetical protein GCM10007887_39860 [Methylobacterium haplocladii]|uniref:Uncharacterized protein n=2 Tax=Methylobacterium haplocladii TaxID=1176176 RepID=A0A512IM87_9HYPH|nr:hypothetical protein MHA02_11930 [Methylobacterium haplocladii]GJD84721.1 hypothetical protein HPGCJGGD_2603 [Methylobacterium haplocladii]GLS61285.1 hypothetical protein GCM10007887_39860 [Methylobacterium haplocladii]
MITQSPPHLRVEVVQASRGDRLWAWTIYRGIGESPIDGSHAIFPSRAVAKRVGTCIKDALPAELPAAFTGPQ